MSEVGADPLAALLSASQALFPDFSYLGPGGVLELGGRHTGVERLRIELPPGQFLHLQSIGITADGVDDVTGLATVRASSWYKNYGENFEPSRLFAFDQPTGTVVHTLADAPAWVEISFSRPLDLSAIRLRNVANATSVRARELRVLLSSEGEWSTIHDGGERCRELDRTLARRLAYFALPPGDETDQLVPILAATITGQYPEARKALDALDIRDTTRKHFRTLVTKELLAQRSLEWTVHGPQRCFRFWSDTEKLRYTEFAAQVAHDLADLTTNVCFGFGAALAVVRDGDLIPHDDDLDLIIGFDPHEAATLPEALRRVEDFLRPRGYTVAGNFSAHRHVSRAGGKHIDIFAGLFEGDTISWYPGTRGALDRQMMFPTSEATLLGVPVPLPRNPLVYLEKLYGPGWRNPDPNFKHTWNRAAYADLVKKRPPA